MDYAEPTEVDRWKAARAKEYEPQEVLAPTHGKMYDS